MISVILSLIIAYIIILVIGAIMSKAEDARYKREALDRRIRTAIKCSNIRAYGAEKAHEINKDV